MHKSIRFSLIVTTLTLYSSCNLIGGIFKAGMWTGVLLIIGTIALIFWLINKKNSSS
jgi:hypothetical protein